MLQATDRYQSSSGVERAVDAARWVFINQRRPARRSQPASAAQSQPASAAPPSLPPSVRSRPAGRRVCLGIAHSSAALALSSAPHQGLDSCMSGMPQTQLWRSFIITPPINCQPRRRVGRKTARLLQAPIFGHAVLAADVAGLRSRPEAAAAFRDEPLCTSGPCSRAGASRLARPWHCLLY